MLKPDEKALAIVFNIQLIETNVESVLADGLLPPYFVAQNGVLSQHAIFKIAINDKQ